LLSACLVVKSLITKPNWNYWQIYI
jgi:hypothetical protein